MDLNQFLELLVYDLPSPCCSARMFWLIKRDRKEIFFAPAVLNKRPLPCGPLPAGTDWGSCGLDAMVREYVTLELFFFWFYSLK